MKTIFTVQGISTLPLSCSQQMSTIWSPKQDPKSDGAVDVPVCMAEFSQGFTLRIKARHN